MTLCHNRAHAHGQPPAPLRPGRPGRRTSRRVASRFAARAVADALAAVTAHIEQRLADGAVVYPATPFRALHGLAPSDVRVVILGQDPYHGPGQAQGLAFSVPDDCKRPPSLRNIFNEIAQEFPGTPCRPAMT